ncbi:MAG: septal ring lytic transglycosylase RlpA family protein [Rhizobacter sp.]
MTETSRHAPPTLIRSITASFTMALVLLLAACASGPGKSTGGRDGPEARPPSGLSDVPDAQPKVEPIRSGGPNKPYEVLGKDYSPMREDGELTERGLASWYGKKFHGRKTASGETYNMYAMTAAHKTMPIPSYARVRNPKNGREIIVRVNDRGPFHAGRVIDLSYTAALKLGVLNGVAPVEVERITFEQIRTGSWQRGNTPSAAPAPTPAVEPVIVAAEPAAVTPPPAPPAPPVPVPATVPDTPPTVAATNAAQGFWVQLGAFRQRDGAEQFQRRVSDELDWLAPLLAVFSEPSMYRLQAGPYPSRGEAQGAADRIRGVLQLVPVIVEKRR